MGAGHISESALHRPNLFLVVTMSRSPVPSPSHLPWSAVSRRGLLTSCVTAAVAAPIAGSARAQQTAPIARPPLKGASLVRLVVNGQPHALAVDPRVTLLDALRDHLGLTGSKKGCDHGQC